MVLQIFISIYFRYGINNILAVNELFTGNCSIFFFYLTNIKNMFMRNNPDNMMLDTSNIVPLANQIHIFLQYSSKSL